MVSIFIGLCHHPWDVPLINSNLEHLIQAAHDTGTLSYQWVLYSEEYMSTINSVRYQQKNLRMYPHLRMSQIFWNFKVLSLILVLVKAHIQRFTVEVV
jgi:hypothetical protein